MTVPPITRNDLPPQSWPEGTVPPAEALADWLTSLTYEQLVWLLERQQRVWAQESDCFLRDHEGIFEQLRHQLQALMEVLHKHGIDPFPAEDREVPS